MDKELFINAWHKKELNLKITEEFWDLRADEFSEKTKNDDIVDFFFDKGIINEQSQILDLGCGPGKYSLEFAKGVKKVSAVDISGEMLKHAKEKAVFNGLNNIDFFKESWQKLDLEQYKWNKKFDLSFASMTPGIMNPEDFFKLIDSSKGYCYVSGFLEREDKLKERLEESIGIRTEVKFHNKMYYMFNILWNMGIYPNMKYVDRVWEKELTIEKALHYYSGLIKQNNNVSEEMEKKLIGVLEKEAINGLINEKVKSKVAQMYWKVSDFK